MRKGCKTRSVDLSFEQNTLMERGVRNDSEKILNMRKKCALNVIGNVGMTLMRRPSRAFFAGKGLKCSGSSAGLWNFVSILDLQGHSAGFRP